MKPNITSIGEDPSLQQVFDYVVRSINDQGRPSFALISGRYAHLPKAKPEDKFTCVYRSPDGAKCAAGWLMRDEDYKPSFDDNAGPDKGVTIEALEKRDLYKFPEHLKQLIGELQNSHDNAALSEHLRAKRIVDGAPFDNSRFLAQFNRSADRIRFEFKLR